MEPVQSKKQTILIWTASVLSVLIIVAIIASSQYDFTSKIKGFEQATNNFIVQTLHSDALTPPPLRGVFGEVAQPLTNEGVLAWTNKNRKTDGKPDLVLNDKLTEMADQKLSDLFAKQYFEHQSPTGVGPGDLAQQAGYDYIVIGENLALGNFNGDKALVDAWMASPGHRANILNARYQEIGIAVGKGTFEGKTTWIAVQEFGLPITACPQPSSVDKAAIDKAKKNIDTLELSLSQQKAAIDNANPKYGTDHNAKVDQYNISVHRFNALVVDLKGKISDYNKEVAKFNGCAEMATSTPIKI